FKVDVVDTTGAGDSFDAGFLFAYLSEKQPLAAALRFANACGALSATGYGGTAAQPTARQVLAMLSDWPACDSARYPAQSSAQRMSMPSRLPRALRRTDTRPGSALSSSNQSSVAWSI